MLTNLIIVGIVILAISFGYVYGLAKGQLNMKAKNLTIRDLYNMKNNLHHNVVKLKDEFERINSLNNRNMCRITSLLEEINELKRSKVNNFGCKLHHSAQGYSYMTELVHDLDKIAKVFKLNCEVSGGQFPQNDTLHLNINDGSKTYTLAIMSLHTYRMYCDQIGFMRKLTNDALRCLLNTYCEFNNINCKRPADKAPMDAECVPKANRNI